MTLTPTFSYIETEIPEGMTAADYRRHVASSKPRRRRRLLRRR